MNRNEAQAISILYDNLMEKIKEKTATLTPPSPTFNESRVFSIVDTVLESNGTVRISWERYIGCGDYEHYTTYTSIEALFED